VQLNIADCNALEDCNAKQLNVGSHGTEEQHKPSINGTNKLHP
jgi:hypothetical protein